MMSYIPRTNDNNDDPALNRRMLHHYYVLICSLSLYIRNAVVQICSPYILQTSVKMKLLCVQVVKKLLGSEIDVSSYWYSDLPHV